MEEKKSLPELIRYGVAGSTTTFVNLAVYHILLAAGMDYQRADLAALILAKIYGYIINKVFVFRSHCGSRRELLRELGSFASARGFTGLIDYLGLVAMVELLGLNARYAKYAVQALVILLNYIFGKFWVFRRRRPQSNKDHDVEEKESRKMEYNTGNLEKHTTKNPLKRYLVHKLNEKIVGSIGRYVLSIESGAPEILDAGCGEGFVDALLLERFTQVSITGLEFTDEALSFARQMNPSAAYIQGDITKMPFPDHSFDIVICTEVLEHLEKPEAALKELIRVARKYVFITVPHEPWFCLGNLLVLKNVGRLGNPIDHINHWSKRSFQVFLQKEGRGNWKVSRSFPWIIAEIVT